MTLKIVKNIFFSLLCIALALKVSPSLAQSMPDEMAIKKHQLRCLDLIYNSKFDSAKLLIAGFTAQEESFKGLFELFSLRWEYIPVTLSKEKDNYLKKLLKFSESISTQSSADRQLYLHTTIELLLAEYYYNSGETFKAIVHGKRAYPLMVQALDAEGNDPELLFVKGMYLYYMDFFRNKGFVYRTALFPFRDGDQKQGLALLENSAMEPSLASTEASIYLAHIYLHLENQPLKALDFSQRLVKCYPENAKFRELLIDNLISCGKYEQAIPHLEVQLKLTYAYFKIPALHFMARVEQEHKKKTGEARRLFKECIDLSSKTKLCEDVAAKSEDYLEKIDKR